MRRGDSTLNLSSGSFLSVGCLADTKKTALGRGVWFRSPNRVERGIIDSTVRYVENIKSMKLTKVDMITLISFFI